MTSDELDTLVLDLAHQLIEQVGGEIRIQPEQIERGWVLRLTLPEPADVSCETKTLH